MAVDPTSGVPPGGAQKPAEQGAGTSRVRSGKTTSGAGQAAAPRRNDVAEAQRLPARILKLRNEIFEGAKTAAQLQLAGESVGRVVADLARMQALASRAATADDADDTTRTGLDKEFADIRIDVARDIETTTFDGENILRDEALQGLLATEAVSLDNLGLEGLGLAAAHAAEAARDTLAGVIERLVTIEGKIAEIEGQRKSKQESVQEKLAAAFAEEGVETLSSVQAEGVSAETIKRITDEMATARLSQGRLDPKNLLPFLG